MAYKQEISFRIDIVEQRFLAAIEIDAATATLSISGLLASTARRFL